MYNDRWIKILDSDSKKDIYINLYRMESIERHGDTAILFRGNNTSMVTFNSEEERETALFLIERENIVDVKTIPIIPAFKKEDNDND